jgi:hypothetical protein
MFFDEYRRYDYNRKKKECGANNIFVAWHERMMAPSFIF